MLNFTKNLCSIILPVFDSERFLSKTLDSILNQTYKNWQLVIVDDCSTDNSEKIISEFVGKNKIQDKVIYHKNINNHGLGLAIAKAAELAQGEFVVQIGHDDIFAHDFLEKQIQILIDKPEILAVFSKVNYINAGDNIENHHQLFRNKVINHYSRHEFFIELMKGNFLCACSGVFRNREGLSGYFGYANDTLQDYELWCNLLLEGEFFYNDTTFANYRIHENNYSLKNKKIAQINFEQFSCISRILHSEGFYRFFEKSADKVLFLRNLIAALLTHSNNRVFEIFIPSFLEYLFARDKNIASEFKYELAKLYQSIGLIFKAYKTNEHKLPIHSDLIAGELSKNVEELDDMQIEKHISQYLLPSNKTNNFNSDNILLKELELKIASETGKKLQFRNNSILDGDHIIANLQPGIGGIIENRINQDNFIILQGWAADLSKKYSKPKLILVFSDGNLVGSTIPHYFRSDIYNFFGKSASVLGFSLLIENRYINKIELFSIFPDMTVKKITNFNKVFAVKLMNKITFFCYKVLRFFYKLKRLVY